MSPAEATGAAITSGPSRAGVRATKPRTAYWRAYYWRHVERKRQQAREAMRRLYWRRKLEQADGR